MSPSSHTISLIPPDIGSDTGRPVHVLLNKSDKLKSDRRAATMIQVNKDLAFLAPSATCRLFSALKSDGLFAYGILYLPPGKL